MARLSLLILFRSTLGVRVHSVFSHISTFCFQLFFPAACIFENHRHNRMFQQRAIHPNGDEFGVRADAFGDRVPVD